VTLTRHPLLVPRSKIE